MNEVCAFQNGGTPSKAIPRYFTGDIPWITGADLVGPVARSARSFITEEAITSSATNKVPAGTVLLVTRTSVGKVAIAGTELCFSQDITALLPDSAKLDAGYLVHFLRTKEEHFSRYARGATIKGITRQVVADLVIPLPPLQEQRRIAAILDQAETLRTQRRTALALLDSLTQSLFLDMFGDPVANPKGWPKVPLTQTCASPDDIRCGPFGTQLLRSEFKTEGVPLWGIKNVNAKFEIPTHEFVDEQTANRLSHYSIEPLDIVMTRKGTVGNCAVYPTSFPSGVMHSDLLRLRVSSKVCLSTFLSHQLHHSQDVERQLTLISGGAVMPGINVSRLKELLVFLPPLPLQQTFATRIASIEALKDTHRRALAALDALFASLQQRAFAGAL
ncbi:restriction endonuclease subunit S [Acidovorax sp. KKS102]|uniref:restriction endonuclease subunit S n=1 Tax=Acidovorax sp. KKS102 TaxID=358220 RepID=UPI001438D5E3|nr:restriction endonuclease subunit S [Acidovorax sp. KKS102]